MSLKVLGDLKQYVKNVLDATGHSSLRSFFFSKTPLHLLWDGGYRDVIYYKTATDGILVGEDYFGNKYYENDKTLPYEKRRWVIYKDPWNMDASQIPPEWHGWLHYVTDYDPVRFDIKKPIYGKPMLARDLSQLGYNPKGSWLEGDNRRNWLKYQAWEPPGGLVKQRQLPADVTKQLPGKLPPA